MSDFEFKPQCDNVECINWCPKYTIYCGCAEGCDENFINGDIDDEENEG